MGLSGALGLLWLGWWQCWQWRWRSIGDEAERLPRLIRKASGDFPADGFRQGFEWDRFRCADHSAPLDDFPRGKPEDGGEFVGRRVFGRRCDGVTTLLELTDGAGKRVELAEIVEHCAADAVFGEGLQFAVAGGIEAVHGADEADGAGGDQVVEFDLRAAPMEFAGEQFHLGKMIEDKLIAVGHDRIGRLRGHLLLGGAVKAVDALDPDLGDVLRGAVLGGVLAGVEFAGDVEMGALGERGGVFSQAAEDYEAVPGGLRLAFAGFAVLPCALGGQRESCESGVVAGVAGFGIAAEVTN